MARMFDFLRQHCEFDATAKFCDLGSGMGRPCFHAASLCPHIELVVGTEFNPHLYKQSMLALRDISVKMPCFQARPRVFFMDSNIKDFASLEPFTHVYSFNIGMPQDVAAHILSLIANSPSVKYAILYPHRTATHKQLMQLGEIVFSTSMAMPGSMAAAGGVAVPCAYPPGGCSYECVVIRINHAHCVDTPVVDSDVSLALEVMRSGPMYDEYLRQLGVVAVLEDELAKCRETRRDRRHMAHTLFLQQNPCFDDISLGLLRRVALKLGVSTAGDKVKILANIQEYVPVTFSLSLFAVGADYDDDIVDRIIVRLLSADPSRRQPEATF